MSSLPSSLVVGESLVELRRAVADDVRRIVELLADDQLGRERDGASGPDGWTPYVAAFEAIDADPGQLLVVATDEDEVVGTLQLTFIPGLSHRGSMRAQIEAVRVAASHRSQGLGAAMLGWSVDEARRRGCGLVQLTTNKSRSDAHRFYERLGFTASHEGFKLSL